MISIIVPVFNTEKYLKKCLDSLINQTYKNIEIIIINDGSTDNSQIIIDEYVKKHPKLVISYKQKNNGQSVARNFGLRKAHGDYIGFVDSDDYVDKNMFKKMYDCVKRNKSDIVVCDCYIEYIDKVEYLSSNLNYSKENDRNYIISHPMVCTRLINKKLFDKKNRFPEGVLYEDLCLSPTLINKTNKISFINEALYYYVQRTNSTMNQVKFNSKFINIFQVLNCIEKNFVENKSYSKYRDEVEYLYITHLLRSASIRFATFKESKKLLKKINIVMKNKYPKWKNNQYYKKSSFKLKLICNLSYHRLYCLLKIITKIKS